MKVNHDPRLHVHFDADCPVKDGDVSLVGCVEFTQCRYDVEQCETTECCEKSALRNPELPVVFNPDCPKVDGDTSIVGCIEFTGCQYQTGMYPETFSSFVWCGDAITSKPFTVGGGWDGSVGGGGLAVLSSLV